MIGPRPERRRFDKAFSFRYNAPTLLWRLPLISILRALGNIVLAILTCCLIVAILVSGYGVIISQVRETAGLDFALHGEAPAIAASEGSWLWIEGEPVFGRTWNAERAAEGGSGWIVLVHGQQIEGSQTWWSTAHALARTGVPVLAVDLRGSGRSSRAPSPEAYTVRKQAELLATVLNEKQLRDALLVGHGWGCAVALQLAYEQPQFVRQMVLIAPTLTARWSPVETALAGVPYVGRALSWTVAGSGPVWQALQRASFHDTADLPTNYWQWARQASRVQGSAEALRAMIQAPHDSDLPGALSRIQAPTLILRGQNDLFVSQEQAAQLAAALPNAQVREIPEAGYFCHIEQAVLVSRQILDLQP